jgi:hypothetical protein
MLKVNENLTCIHHRWVEMKSWCELGQCPCIHEPCLFFVNKYKEWERQRDEKTVQVSAGSDR